MRLDWAAMDAWFEEDEEVYTHPRDPYTRVDILASSRHVRVEVDGVDGRRVAGAADPLRDRPAAALLPAPDATSGMDLLVPDRHGRATARTRAGASYWSVHAGDGVHRGPRVVYRTPLPESQKIAGLVAFYNEKVDIYVDGKLQERPRTKFS